MRVTNVMTSKALIKDVQRTYEKLAGYQMQLSSGLRIMEPSDDPAGAERVGILEKKIAEITQFNANIDYALDEMKATNQYGNNVLDILDRVKQITVSANNGILSQTQLDTYAYEIEEAMKTILTYANGNINNKYLFAGYQTATKPFVETKAAGGLITAVDYFGDTGQRVIEVSQGRTVTLSFAGANTPTAGGSVFPPDLTVPGAFVDGNAPLKDIFATLIALRDDLFAGDLATFATTDVPAMSTYTTMLSQLVGMQAVQIDELENLKDTHDQEILSKTSLKVDIEEIDAAETMSNISNQQVAYQAALKVSASMLTVTLFDYL